MNREIMRQKEMLLKLNSELYDFKRMLDGQNATENGTEAKEECLCDIIKINSLYIELALKTLDQIKQTMVGE